MQLLPQLADLFHVTLDDLFGREAPQPERTAEQEEMEMERILPWPDDDTLYTVVYHGHQLLTEETAALRRSGGERQQLVRRGVREWPGRRQCYRRRRREVRRGRRQCHG